MSIKITTNLVTRTKDYPVTTTDFINHTKNDSSVTRLDVLINELYSGNSWFHTVINLPSSPHLGEEILYVGEDTDKLSKFGIYEYDGSDWQFIVSLYTDTSLFPTRSEVKGVYDSIKVTQISEDSQDYSLVLPSVSYTMPNDPKTELVSK